MIGDVYFSGYNWYLITATHKEYIRVLRIARKIDHAPPHGSNCQVLSGIDSHTWLKEALTGMVKVPNATAQLLTKTFINKNICAGTRTGKLNG